MRRNIKNDKVLRAITIGLATMIAVTSTPLTVFAGEGDEAGEDGGEVAGSTTTGTTPATGGDNSGDGSETSTSSVPSTPIVIDIRGVQAGIAGMASAAEGYAGTLKEGDTAAQGEIGEKAQSALDAIGNANSALDAADTFYQTAGKIEEKIDNLYSQNHGTNGKGQLDKAEDIEKDFEKAYGVTFDPVTGEAKTKGFDDKVINANEKIAAAEEAKTDAYDELKAVDDQIAKAEKKIAKAETKKAEADTDTLAAEKAKGEDLTKVQNATKEELNKIQKELEGAVVADDLSAAVSAVSQASGDAAQLAGEKLNIAQQALQSAEQAADDAERNGTRYSRQQMINLATTAQEAASSAQEAAKLTEKALEDAKGKEIEAQNALNAAGTALTDAKTEAAGVLSAYKTKIEELNGIIDDANASRKAAKRAMKKANKAIDAALELMGSSDTTVQGAKTALLAFNTAMDAIKEANEAIEGVTDITVTYTKNGVKEIKTIAYADKVREDANSYVTKAYKNLDKAKGVYDKAIKATGTAKANKESAEETVEELDKLINQTGNLFDKWAGDSEQGIEDIKALLVTGNLSHKGLIDAVNSANKAFNEADAELVAKNDGREGDEDKNLTSEQIVEKYNEYKSRVDKINGGLFADAKEEAYNAHTAVTTEFGNMSGKYKLNSDGTDYVKVNGEYVLSDDYKALQAACDPNDPANVKPDDFKYVNDNDETDIQDEYLKYWSQAQEDNGNKIYLFDDKKKVGGPEILSGTYNENAVPYGSYTFEKGEKDGKTVIFETITKVYSVPTEKYEDRKTVNQQWVGREPQNETQAIKTVIQDEVRRLTGYADAKVNVSPGGQTATVNINGKTISYKFSIKNVKWSEVESVTTGPRWGWFINYDLTLQEKVIGSTDKYFTQKQAYECKVYTKKNFGGGLTDTASEALGRKNDIDKTADPTKYDAAKKRQETASGIYTNLYNELSKKSGFVDALKDEVEKYNTASGNKKGIDAAKKKFDEFDVDNNDETKTAKTNLGRINSAKEKAQGYLGQVNTKLGTLAEREDKDVSAEYDRVKGKIDNAQVRLDNVQAKLNTLKKLQEAAIANEDGKGLTTLEVDNKVTLEDGTKKGLKKYKNSLKDKLDELNKFENLKAYNRLKLISTKVPSVDLLTADFLGNGLAAALESATSVIQTQQDNLNKIKGQITEIEKILYGVHKPADEGEVSDLEEVEEFEEVDGLWDIYNKAQAAADRASRALADWRAPRDDDDEGSGSTSGTDSYFYPVAETGIPVIDLTGLNLGDTGRGVAGVRTRRTVSRVAAADTSGVLGVKAEEMNDTKKNVVDENKDATKDDTKKSEEGSKSPTKVADPETPLADTPFEEGTNMNLLWLLGAAAAAGAGAYGYDKHRKKVAANDEAKKYKK